MNTPTGTSEDTRTNAMALPDDVARCNGVGSEREGWREGCAICLRRTAQRGKYVAMIAPPAILAFDCELLIEPNS